MTKVQGVIYSFIIYGLIFFVVLATNLAAPIVIMALPPTICVGVFIIYLVLIRVVNGAPGSEKRARVKAEYEEMRRRRGY